MSGLKTFCEQVVGLAGATCIYKCIYIYICNVEIYALFIYILFLTCKQYNLLFFICKQYSTVNIQTYSYSQVRLYKYCIYIIHFNRELFMFFHLSCPIHSVSLTLDPCNPIEHSTLCQDARH